MLRNSIIFVLDHPKNPENIGLAARAMANFGFMRLRLVAPEGLDHARRIARHGAAVVEQAQVYDTLEQALADLTVVLTTTGLKELVGEEPLLPGPAARWLAESSQAGPVGLLFGCERIGLTAAQVLMGDRICRVPTWADCPSMNLSHAVGLFAWELNQATGSVGSLPAEPPATWAEKRLALDKLDQALQALELKPEGRRQALLLGLKEFLDRRAMSQGDAKYVLQGLNLLIKRLGEWKPGGQ